MREPIDIRYLAASDIDLLGKIDRSEVIDTLYSVQDHELVGRPTDVDVPDWSRVGDGEHSVAKMLKQWRPIAEDGATLLGAYDGDEFLGLALVIGELQPGLAWLALLHVGRIDVYVCIGDPERFGCWLLSRSRMSAGRPATSGPPGRRTGGHPLRLPDRLIRSARSA